MAVVAITGGPGAPGATSSALALLLSWPLPEGRRVLLLEADPDGGAVLAGALQGQVEAGAGLRNLALAERRGRLLETMWEQCLDLSADRSGDRLLLPGLSDPAQAAALAMTWDPLAEACQALDSLGCDVLVDLGRSGGLGPSGVLARRADLVVTVLRTTLRGLSAARPRVAALADELNEEGRADLLGLLLVQQGPYSGGEISRALSAPVLGVLPHAPKEAHTLSDGGRTGDRRFLRSPLMRAARTAADELSRIAGARHKQFARADAVSAAQAAAAAVGAGAQGSPQQATTAPTPATAPGPRHAASPAQVERPQPAAVQAACAGPELHQVPSQTPLAPAAQQLGYRAALSHAAPGAGGPPGTGQVPGGPTGYGPALNGYAGHPQAVNGQAAGPTPAGQAGPGQALNGYAGHPQAVNGQAVYGQASPGQGPVGQAGGGRTGPGQGSLGRAVNGHGGHPQALDGQAPYGQVTSGQGPSGQGGYPQALPGQAAYGPLAPGASAAGQLGPGPSGAAQPSFGHAPNARPVNGQAQQGHGVPPQPGHPVPASGDPWLRPWSVQDVLRLAASARLDDEGPVPFDAVYADRPEDAPRSGAPTTSGVPGTFAPGAAPVPGMHQAPATPGAPAAAHSVTPGQAARVRAVHLEPEGGAHVAGGADQPRPSYRPAGEETGPFVPIDDRDWFTPLHFAPPPPLAEHAPRPPAPQQFQHLAPPVPQAQPAPEPDGVPAPGTAPEPGIAPEPGTAQKNDVPPNDTPPSGEVAHVR